MSLFWVPSFALSLHIEAERPEQNYLSTRAANGLLAASQFVSGFFALESRLCAALHHELVLRGADGPISSTTLRTLDSVLYASVASPDPRSATLDKRDQYYSRVGNGDVGDLAYTLALESGLAPTGDTYDLLVTSLTRILNSYALCEVVALRSLVPCVPGQDDALLRRLWSLYKPDTPLVALKSKQWQDLGFQNDHPSTDVRGVGMLALDALIYFAEAYPSDVVEKVLQESVEGGEHWYPFALASITITNFTLELAEQRDLQLLFLRSYQVAPSGSSSIDPKPFLEVDIQLLLLFHSHWRKGGYTVMQFEQVFAEFKLALRPWIRRGVIEGRGLPGWTEVGSIKLE